MASPSHLPPVTSATPSFLTVPAHRAIDRPSRSQHPRSMRSAPYASHRGSGPSQVYSDEPTDHDLRRISKDTEGIWRQNEGIDRVVMAWCPVGVWATAVFPGEVLFPSQQISHPSGWVHYRYSSLRLGVVSVWRTDFNTLTADDAYISVSEMGHCGFGQWLGTEQGPSHYPN